MGTGTDVAMESAAITLIKGDLQGIVRARRLSRATMRNIRQNLFFAFVFNAPRFIAFLGLLFAGTLIVQFGGYGKAAMIFACIYVLGFFAAPFLPETKGRPLPENV